MPAYEQTVRGESVHEDIVPTCFEKGSATFCTLASSRWTACSWTSRPPTPHWSMLHWSDRSWNTPSYLTSSVDQKDIEDRGHSDQQSCPTITGYFVSKLLRTRPTFQSLTAIRTMAIRHATSSTTTCSHHLVASLIQLRSSPRLIIASTCHVPSLGQQQTLTDHSPHAVWSDQALHRHSISDAKCQEMARAGALRCYKCLRGPWSWPFLSSAL